MCRICTKLEHENNHLSHKNNDQTELNQIKWVLYVCCWWIYPLSNNHLTPLSHFTMMLPKTKAFCLRVKTTGVPDLESRFNSAFTAELACCFLFSCCVFISASLTWAETLQELWSLLLCRSLFTVWTNSHGGDSVFTVIPCENELQLGFLDSSVSLADYGGEFIHWWLLT